MFGSCAHNGFYRLIHQDRGAIVHAPSDKEHVVGAFCILLRGCGVYKLNGNDGVIPNAWVSGWGRAVALM